MERSPHKQHNRDRKPANPPLDVVHKRLVDGTAWAKTAKVDLNAIKPCVAAMGATVLSGGERPNQADINIAMASELRRIGVDKEMAFNVISEWNQQHVKGMSEKELRHAVNQAYRIEYKFSCLHATLKAFCVSESLCPYVKSCTQNNKYHNNRYFVRHGWQHTLGNAAKLIYLVGLIELERRLGVGAGGLIYTSHRRLAQLTGIEERSVRTGLNVLSRFGLIEYKKGVSQRWLRKGSEIRRVLPIPKRNERQNERGKSDGVSHAKWPHIMAVSEGTSVRSGG